MMPEETPVKTPVTRPGRNGGRLNVGGNHNPQGAGGRPTDAWKQMCRDAVSREDRFNIAEEIVMDKDHPAWLGAFKFLVEQGYGKATQSVDLSSGGQPMKAYIVFDPEKDV